MTKWWNIHHAEVFLKWTIPIIRISYSFRILLDSIELWVITFLRPKWLLVYLWNCLIILRRQTTTAQCHTMKARDGKDLSGHSVPPCQVTVLSPEKGCTKCIIVSSWWWIRMSQILDHKKLPQGLWQMEHILHIVGYNAYATKIKKAGQKKKMWLWRNFNKTSMAWH